MNYYVRSFFLAAGWGIGAGLLIAVDRITKWHAMRYYAESSYNINRLLSFCYELNRGVSWNLFAGQHQLALTMVITIITCCICTWFIVQWPHVTRLSVGLWLITCGSTSNIVDRVMYGGVIDWIAIHPWGFDLPIFNIADCLIVTGTLLVGYWMHV